LPTEKVRCYFKNYNNGKQAKGLCNRRRRRSSRQVAQPNDGWEDFPGKISKYKDYFSEQDEAENIEQAEKEAEGETTRRWGRRKKMHLRHHRKMEN
jgi:hypothetical protein